MDNATLLIDASAANTTFTCGSKKFAIRNWIGFIPAPIASYSMVHFAITGRYRKPFQKYYSRRAENGGRPMGILFRNGRPTIIATLAENYGLELPA